MKNSPPATTERGIAQQKFKNARSNLLLVVIFTAINIIMISAGSYNMLLFSATVPYLSVVFGLAMEVQPLMVGGYAVALVLLAVYLLCWLQSKKNVGWMIAALVLFALDTAFMAFIYWLLEDVSGILDAVIHVFVLYYLVVGVKNGRLLKTLPEDPAPEEAAPEMPPISLPDEQPTESYTDGIE